MRTSIIILLLTKYNILFATNMGIDRVPDASRLEISDVSYSKEHIHISQITLGMRQMIDP